ncbi:MAG: FecR domain-containing protein [Gammaproteobacteria bacterium]|nr:FecR domain-containing protein [Gammaproteobacteria bacterium]
MVFAKGIVSLVKENKSIKILGRGDQLYENDLIRTGERSKAIIKLIDGTQLSLIENTHFTVKKLSLEKANEKADLHLLKGGLRAITGLVNKNKTGKFKLITPVASIGIRGTDFTTYLCKTNCKESSQKSSKDAEKIIKEDTDVKGRILVIKGDVSAKDADGETRQLHKNSPLYEGDTIVTGRHAITVIVFKDNSRTTVQANTQFLIENYAYKPKTPKQSQASFKLIKGSMRFLTGKIGKLNREKFKVTTPTSSIGIRGTGFDLSYGNVTYLFLWEGKVHFIYPLGELMVDQGQSFSLSPGQLTPKLIDKIPATYQEGPRPDDPEISEQVDLPELFGARQTDGDVGLYVHVTQGEVEIDNDGIKLNLGKNETGFLGDDKTVYRLIEPPKFLTDPFIPPNLDDKSLTKIKVFSQIFDEDEIKDTGSICEVK